MTPNPLLSADGGKVEGDVGEHIKQITILCINQYTDLCQLLFAVASLLQSFEQLSSGFRLAPQYSQLILILEQFRQITIELIDELCCRYRFALRTPEGGCGHLLNGPLLAIR